MVGVLALSGLLAMGARTNAAIITWEFEAIVRGTSGTPSGAPDYLTFFPGQILRGRIGFESTTPPYLALSTLGQYRGAITSLEIDYLTYFEPVPPGPYALGSASDPTTSVINVRNLSLDYFFAVSDFEPAQLPYYLGVTSIESVELFVQAPDFMTGIDLPLVPPMPLS
jgi:hypothetical protein